MKNNLLLILLLISISSVYSQVNKIIDPVEWVNPLMGTDSKPSLSNGNTYPAVCVPWGMNFWTPQTGPMGNGWQYQYTADKIRGFKQTHQPSPWMNDYGQFSIMPVTGKLKFRQDDRASWFSHKSEIAKPYYYGVYLADADVTTELTTTERAAFFRFTFPETDSAFIVIDAFDRGSYVKILPLERKVIGFSTRYSRGNMPNFKNYFVIYFDKPFTLNYTWRDSTLVKDSLELKSNHTGAIVGFKTKKENSFTQKLLRLSFHLTRQNLVKFLNDDDTRTFGVCIGIKTKMKSEVFSSILVRRKPLIRIGKGGLFHVYDIICAKDFNPNERTGYAFSKGNPRFSLAEQLRRAVLSFYKYHSGKEEEILIPRVKKVTLATEKEKEIAYQCKNCKTVYDEKYGDPENGIDPCTLFQELPVSYCCSVCDATKDNFVAVKKEAIGL